MYVCAYLLVRVDFYPFLCVSLAGGFCVLARSVHNSCLVVADEVAVEGRQL